MSAWQGQWPGNWSGQWYGPATGRVYLDASLLANGTGTGTFTAELEAGVPPLWGGMGGGHWWLQFSRPRRAPPRPRPQVTRPKRPVDEDEALTLAALLH